MTDRADSVVARDSATEGDLADPSTSAVSSHARREYRRVAILTSTSVFVLALSGVIYWLVPPSFAPRVNVRWREGLSEATRTQVERQVRLVAGEHVEGTTWTYDLIDPTSQGIEAIVSHPAAEDTHHIDRATRTLSPEVARGTTRIRGGLSRWRDSPVQVWLVRFATSFLIVSGIWLASTGRRASR